MAWRWTGRIPHDPTAWDLSATTLRVGSLASPQQANGASGHLGACDPARIFVTETASLGDVAWLDADCMYAASCLASRGRCSLDL